MKPRCLVAILMLMALTASSKLSAVSSAGSLRLQSKQTAVSATKLTLIRAGLLILDPRREPQRNAAILVENGRIRAAASGVVAPTGTDVLDLSDFTVLPGLLDGHAHLYTGELASMRMTAAEKAFYAQQAVRYALDSGVTAMRILGADDHVDIGVRNAIHKGLIPGPRLLVAAYSLSIPGGHADQFPFSAMYAMDDVFTPRRGFINTPDQAEEAIHWQVKYGADIIKLNASGGAGSPLDDPSQASLSADEIRRAVEKAHALGKRVAAHAQNLRSIRYCVEAGVDSIEHGSELDERIIALMKQKRIFLDMSPIHRLEAAGKQFANNEEVIWRKRRALYKKQVESFKLAVREAALFSGGSDVGYNPGGPTLATELTTWVSLGMSPRDALISATVNNAELFDLASEIGTLEPGKVADVIAVRGNPLEDIQALGNVVFVMRNGQIHLHRK